MNQFDHDQLRAIISACYNHFGFDIQVTPDPSQPISPSNRRRILRNYRQFKQRMTQGTQTSPPTSPFTNQTAQQTSPLATPSTSFAHQEIPSRLPAAPAYATSGSVIQQAGTSTFTTLQPMSIDTTAIPPRSRGAPVEHPSILAALRRTQRLGKKPKLFL